MSTINDQARIKCFGTGVPIVDFKLFDSAQGIWVGTRVVEPGTPDSAFLTVYFSRDYSPTNDLDKMLHEYAINDATLLGKPFLVVPKEKLLFGYDPPSSVILKPSIRTKPSNIPFVE